MYLKKSSRPKKKKSVKYYLTLGMVLFYFSSINSQNTESKSMLRNFSKNAYYSEVVNMDSIYKHLKVHKKLEGNEEFEKHIKYFFDLYKKEVFDDLNNVHFLQYNEVAQNENLKNKSLFKDLVYKNKNQVYYMTNKEQNELAGPYVIKGKKIIAFMPAINFGGNDNVYPLLLNKKITARYISEVNKYFGL